MTSKIVYKGNLRTEMIHNQSGSSVETDAPIDNQGNGSLFLLISGIGLGSCMLTIMGIASNTHEIQIEGTEVEVNKVMHSSPRRIGEISIKMTIKGQDQYTEKQKTILEHAAITCPVYLSLSEDVKKIVEFVWP